MKANETTVGDLFQRDVRFIAPLYQRPYVWTRDRNWVPLWDAIRIVAERQGQAASLLNHPYFLGAIVLEPLNLPSSRVTSWQLIDGQQRLTTLQVAMARWAELCHERGYEDLAAGFAALTRNRLLSTQDTTEEFKVWPTNRDRATFAAVLRAQKPPASADERNALLLDAAVFFKSQLNDWIEEQGGDTRPGLERLLTALTRSLVLVEIRLEPDDDPQQIFETLNSLGTPLLTADLVKNLLFRGLNDHEAAALHAETWERFEDRAIFWRERVRQGRLLTPRIDLFLQHYLAARVTQDVPATDLFTVFRRYFQVSGRTPREQLRELREYADIFESISTLPQKEATSRLGSVLRRLQGLDTTTIYPLVLEMFRNLGAEEYTAGLLVLESYLVRRAVCRLTTKNYNKLFVQVLREWETDWRPDRLPEILLKFHDDASRWPSDDELRASWTTVAAYRTLGTGRLLSMFEALERELRSLKSEEITVSGELTIEHLLPRGWSEENWPLPANIPESVAKDERNSLLHTIGNLTVITGRLNTQQSNRPWSEKRPILLKHSVSLLNNTLPSAWTHESIKARSLELLELAVRAWARPTRADDLAWRSVEHAEAADAEETEASEPEEGSRGSAYRAFFRSVFEGFRSVRPHAATSSGSAGWSWFNFPTKGTAGSQVRYGWSFAMGKKLRCELYLDAPTKTTAKQMFDVIASERTAIEDSYGSALSWERLDTGRASRIADYRDGNVYDEPEVFNDLLDWAINAMVRFYDLLDPRLTSLQR